SFPRGGRRHAGWRLAWPPAARGGRCLPAAMGAAAAGGDRTPGKRTARPGRALFRVRPGNAVRTGPAPDARYAAALSVAGFSARFAGGQPARYPGLAG